MLTIILFVFMWIVICLWTYTSSSRGHKLPPAYSVELPLIGHAYLILGTPSGLWRTLRKCSLACIENGGVMYFKIFHQIHYLITDPDDAVTVANTCLKKHYIYDYVKPFVGNGLFTAPVDLWKQRRKCILPAFSLPVVQGFMDVFNAQSKKIVYELEQYVEKGQFNPSWILNKNFYEAFLLTSLGVNVEEDFEFIRNYMEIVELCKSAAMTRFQKPWLMSDFLFNLFGYKKIETELVNDLRKLFDVTAVDFQLLQRKKLTMKDIEIYKEPHDREIKGKPLLNLLLELSSNNIINENDIAENVNTALVGGYESIANMLLVTMVFLGQYPEVHKRTYEEVMAVVGKEREVNKTDIPNLVYMEAVILESLRFYTTAPALPRQVETDVKLKNYTLRKGTYCIILPIGLHQNDAWGDSVKFRPERWLEPETLPKKCYSGFSLGKRNCIAKTYSLYTMKVALVHILRRYRIESNEENLKFSVNMTTKVEGTVALYNRSKYIY